MAATKLVNMKEYMVEIKLPHEFSSKFIALIPKQRAMVNELLGKHRILHYTLSADRVRLWIVFSAKSRKEVESMIAEFPLIEWMRYQINDLSFHNSIYRDLPVISLN